MKLPPKVRAIVVLSDDDTWTEVSGCSLIILEEAEFQRLNDGEVKVKDCMAMTKIALEKVL